MSSAGAACKNMPGPMHYKFTGRRYAAQTKINNRHFYRQVALRGYKHFEVYSLLQTYRYYLAKKNKTKLK
jgi:hypothetical protein